MTWLRLARTIGHAPRVLSGWVPTLEDPSEWNQNQREMMFALAEVEADICPGCGGFLSFTTVFDHALNVSRIECKHCLAIHVQQAQWEKEFEADKKLAPNTVTLWEPAAQRIVTRPVPLVPEQIAEAQSQGIYGKTREGE